MGRIRLFLKWLLPELSFSDRPLVKGNEDSGNEIGPLHVQLIDAEVFFFTSFSSAGNSFRSRLNLW